MDEIRIDNLKVFAHHGVFPEETKNGQNFYVNAVLKTNTRCAGLTDGLEYSTHYGIVCEKITDFLQNNTYKLIEAAAEHTVKMLLTEFPLIKECVFELRKPEAPINLPFESVSVKIARGWKECYLAIGSNIGDRNAYMDMAIEMLKADSDFRNIVCSSRITTKPYGGVEQEDFLNGAIKVETLLAPEELLGRLHEIEAKADRKREIHWGPRTLDLDILFYEEDIISSPTLTVPHIDMENRDFVLVPLAELAFWKRHPVTGKTVGAMLAELKHE